MCDYVRVYITSTTYSSTNLRFTHFYEGGKFSLAYFLMRMLNLAMNLKKKREELRVQCLEEVD